MSKCPPSLCPHILLHPTHVAEEFICQTQVIVKRQEGHSLQPHHDDLQGWGAGPEEGSGQDQQPASAASTEVCCSGVISNKSAYPPPHRCLG